LVGCTYKYSRSTELIDPSEPIKPYDNTFFPNPHFLHHSAPIG